MSCCPSDPVTRTHSQNNTIQFEMYNYSCLTLPWKSIGEPPRFLSFYLLIKYSGAWIKVMVVPLVDNVKLKPLQTSRWMLYDEIFILVRTWSFCMTFKACWHSRVITGRLKDLPDSPLISPLPLLRQGNPDHLNEEKLRSRMNRSAAVIRPLKSTCIRCMNDLLFSNSVNLSEVMEYFRTQV